MSIDLVMPFNHLILYHPLLLLPSIFPSITVFSNELALHIRWHFSFSISPSNEYSGLISFMFNWFDLLAVQGTLKSLLQQHSLKASLLQLYSNFKTNKQKKEIPRKERPRILPHTWGLYPQALHTDQHEEHLIAGCS